MKLLETPIVVGSREGPPVERDAILFSCPKCHSEDFKLYSIFNTAKTAAHLHLQCATCAETYCHGGSSCIE